MKNMMFIAAALLLTMAAPAQDRKPVTGKKAYLSLNVGMGIPIGPFASTTDAEGGLATGGFTTDLTASYDLQRGFGVGGDLFYSNFGVNNDDLGTYGMNLDHWKIWGFVVGPDLHGKLAKNLFLDVRIHAGVARANSPVLSFRNESSEDLWVTALAFRPGADLRLFFNERAFLRFNTEYTYLHPTFKYPVIGDVDQKISALHYGLGIGFTL